MCVCVCVVEVAMHGVGGGGGAPWAERACAWGVVACVREVVA